MTFTIMTVREHDFKWWYVVFSGDDDKKKRVKKDKKKGTGGSTKTNTPVSSAKATPSKAAKVTVENVPEDDSIENVCSYFWKHSLYGKNVNTFHSFIDHRSFGKSLGSKKQG